MSRLWPASSSWIWLLALGVFISRLPFLQPGFGDDPDAWRIANAARHIATSGAYQPSRLPGNPLVEGAYALLWSLGGRTIAFNAATAAMSALCAATFALYLRRLKSREYLWGGVALAFTPVFYIHSVNSMDYVWSLTFILLASYFAIASQPLPSGICLGLGIACRLTAGAMLIPVCLMLASRSGFSLRKILLLALPAAFVGGLAYVPSIFLHGGAAFSFVDGPRDPLEVTYLASVGVWGVIGLIAILLAALVALRKLPAGSTSVNGDAFLSTSWAVALLLYAVAFLRLPHESGYLLPVVPFGILIIGRHTSSRAFRMLCLALMLSPFLVSIDRTAIYGKGAVIRDHLRRKDTVDFVERATRAGDAVTTKTVVVAGWYLPMIEAELGNDSRGLTRYVGLIGSADLERFRENGYAVYYLAPIRQYNLQVHGIDLEDADVPELKVPED